MNFRNKRKKNTAQQTKTKREKLLFIEDVTYYFFFVQEIDSFEFIKKQQKLGSVGVCNEFPIHKCSKLVIILLFM